jgi:hypothetical protein
MKKQSTMTFDKIQKLWNSQPFLERLFFLIRELKLNQDDAEKLAKLNFKNLTDNYKVEIYQVLN